jgi:hypothetical protein
VINFVTVNLYLHTIIIKLNEVCKIIKNTFPSPLVCLFNKQCTCFGPVVDIGMVCVSEPRQLSQYSEYTGRPEKWDQFPAGADSSPLHSDPLWGIPVPSYLMHNSGFFWGAVHPLPYVFMG